MKNSLFNPKPSDYLRQYRLGFIAIIVSLLLLIGGFSSDSETLKTIMVSAGIGLMIGGGAVILTARRSQERAKKMNDG